MKRLFNNQGFSLIETIASIVLISLLLIGFAQLFLQSNKTAVYNNDKLSLINLADAQLERLQSISFKSEDELNFYMQLIGTPENHFEMNDTTYTVKVVKNTDTISRGGSVSNLIPVKVTVKSINSNIPSESVAEGYVKITR